MCEEVLRETPCEEHVLNLLAMVYKPLGHRDRMTAAYAAASAAQPKDLRLLYGLFCAYVRSCTISSCVRGHRNLVVKHALQSALLSL